MNTQSVSFVFTQHSWRCKNYNAVFSREDGSAQDFNGFLTQGYRMILSLGGIWGNDDTVFRDYEDYGRT